MKHSLVKDEMTLLLDNISEQYDMMNQHEKMIPQIEIDLFMRNIQKLYENALYLNRINSKMETEEHRNKTLDEGKNEILIDSIQASIQEDHLSNKHEGTNEDVLEKKEDEAELSIKVREVNPELPTQELMPEEVENEDAQQAVIAKEETVVQVAIVENEIPISNEIEAEKDDSSEVQMEADPEDQIKDDSTEFSDVYEEKEAEVDLFTEVKANDEISDLNRKLAEARNAQSIVEKLQSKRIESLKSVIGINDKFYFINELFAGNTQKYEDIIYTLNNFKKLEDAMVYFSTLKYKFSWNEDSDAYIKLSQMLERKFEWVDV